jgi:Cof subfamily protein (haloacid dehalogenase superfamily)
MIVNKNIKVIVSDLDGTLLNSNHTISDKTISVFQKLHLHNYLIIVATGRHHLDAMPILDSLGFPVYLVSSNGARIHSPDKKLLYSFDIKSDHIQSVLSIDIDPDITTVLFKEDIWFTNKFNKKLNDFQPEIRYRPELVNFNELEDYAGIKLLFTHENHSKLLTVRDRILEKHEGLFNHAFSLPFCLEFMDKSVDKSVAIANILELENFSFQETLVFGDGYNDENMLREAGIGVLMENAPQSLKELLPQLEITTTNETDGVANYITNKIINSKLELQQ